MRAVYFALCLLVVAMAGLPAQAGWIATVKASYPDGAAVYIGGNVVADFSASTCDRCVYIEDEDMTCGIKAYNIVGPETIFWAFHGILGTDANGERFVRQYPAPMYGLYSVELPFVYHTNRDLGGSNYAWTPWGTVGQRGVAQGIGCNDIGRFMRTTGMLMSVDPSFKSFYIDDGTCPFDGAGRRRIRVSYQDVPGFVAPPLYSNVCVRGICSLYIWSGTARPLIRLRKASDVRLL